MDIWIPVVLAVVTGAVAWVGLLLNHWLAKRDLRANIKADHELYNEIDDEFHKNALKASIDARLEHLALRSMPLEYEGRQSIRRLRTTVALGLLVLFYGQVLFGTWNTRHAADGQASVTSWLYEQPWVGLVLSLGGAAAVGIGLNRLKTERVIAQLKQFSLYLDKDISRLKSPQERSSAPTGPGSAGTVPDQEDTA